MERRRVSSKSPLEPVIGFSRAVRVGQVIAVSGTAPIDEGGKVLHPGDVAGQTRSCLQIAERSLRELGADLSSVIRTRIMLTDARKWREAAQAHGECFGGVLPACTFVEVSSFIDKDWLVEIEIDAIVSDKI